MDTPNLAARAGRWSARHRGKVILGWLLFVVIAVMAGGAAGMKEIASEDLGSGESRRADQIIADGLAKTARVITAAAAIMVVVFLAFLAAPDVFLKLFGIALASAIFLDATVIRMVLAPAVMQLLGSRNWWIPSWLERILPRLDVERVALTPTEGRA
jgi:uncharacterized membrane protein YdfJ with MMPL/SSD domain